MVWLTMAMAGSAASPALQVPLAGTQDCDAAERLEAAMVATLETLPARVAEAGACDHTSLYRGSVLALYQRVDEATQRHGDDSEALVALWSGMATLRFGLLGDAVRLIHATEVWTALQAHPDGPWRAKAVALMAQEPGPQPAQDAIAFQEMLWSQGATMQTLPYLVAMPLHRWAAQSAQEALTTRNPRPKLDALEDAWWAVGSAHGVARVTADLHEDYVRLEEAVAEGRAPTARRGRD
jgi:hypothetical protein